MKSLVLKEFIVKDIQAILKCRNCGTERLSIEHAGKVVEGPDVLVYCDHEDCHKYNLHGVIGYKIIADVKPYKPLEVVKSEPVQIVESSGALEFEDPEGKVVEFKEVKMENA